MSLAELISRLHKLRIDNLKNPKKAGFESVMGVVRKSYNVFCICPPLKFRGFIKLRYADQNPNPLSYKLSGKRTHEAHMVATKQWKPWDVGWLYAKIGGKFRWLARVCPADTKQLVLGEYYRDKNVLVVNSLNKPKNNHLKY